MITVALDVGPLCGPLTGVGRAVSAVLDGMRQRTSDVDVVPYVVSRRAKLTPGTRRLPFPALVAISAWSHFDHPRADRYLGKVDVVHGLNYVVPPMRCPRVVSVFDSWALRHPEACPAVINRAMRVLQRNVRSGAVIHTSSHSTAADLELLFPGTPIHVVHLAAPRIEGTAHDVEASSDSESPFILMVGTVERRKNMPRFVEAFAGSDAARSGVRLVIAGGVGDDSQNLAITLEELDPRVRSQVEVLGRVTDAELERLYRHATLVAYPSLDEGFGFPLLEAMARGIPVVAANRGSIPEIAGDAAVMVDPCDSDALSSAIDQTMFDDTRRRHLIAAGHVQCQKFTWEKTVDGLLDLYNGLVHADVPRGR